MYHPQICLPWPIPICFGWNFFSTTAMVSTGAGIEMTGNTVTLSTGGHDGLALLWLITACTTLIFAGMGVRKLLPKRRAR